MLQLYSIFHLNIAYSSIEKEQRPKVDELVKSPKNVMPDPVSGTGQARSGIQNILKLSARALWRTFVCLHATHRQAGMTKNGVF
ncbi:MAG: hypothetical protein U9R02_14220 [Thermodesulfobacteriota bacterium]|nr:hypothetical protein [Thermodesulfobacteriota bacterium]